MTMSKEQFDKYKIDFYNLTGKEAANDLAAYFNYLQMMNQFDIKDKLNHIHQKLVEIEINTK